MGSPRTRPCGQLHQRHPGVGHGGHVATNAELGVSTAIVGRDTRAVGLQRPRGSGQCRCGGGVEDQRDRGQSIGPNPGHRPHCPSVSGSNAVHLCPCHGRSRTSASRQRRAARVVRGVVLVKSPWPGCMGGKHLDVRFGVRSGQELVEPGGHGVGCEVGASRVSRRLHKKKARGSGLFHEVCRGSLGVCHQVESNGKVVVDEVVSEVVEERT